MPEILSHIGNLDLLERPKTAFLCSSKTTSRDILKSFDWATSVPKDSCIISGFQTKLEKDVLQLLLKRHIPVIIVLARRMYKVLPAEMQSAIDSNEALIISLSHLPRNSKQSALARNKYIISIADNVVFGALDPTSSLTNLVEEQKLLGIEIHASVWYQRIMRKIQSQNTEEVVGKDRWSCRKR